MLNGNRPVVGVGESSDPHLYRWMLFVDGENLAIRAKELANDRSIQLTEGAYYKENVFAWLPGVAARKPIIEEATGRSRLRPEAVRSYYYTSVQGGEDIIKSVKKRLWDAGYQPEVFKRPRTRPNSKGADITLAKDLLSNAFLDNYVVAILVVGDGDFVPLVEEVKRLGKIVYVAFFEGKEHGLNPDLIIASDFFWHTNDLFVDAWTGATY
jgi:uncharacterized LabA/DUF88 family protein